MDYLTSHISVRAELVTAFAVFVLAIAALAKVLSAKWQGARWGVGLALAVLMMAMLGRLVVGLVAVLGVPDNENGLPDGVIVAMWLTDLLASMLQVIAFLFFVGAALQLRLVFPSKATGQAVVPSAPLVGVSVLAEPAGLVAPHESRPDKPAPAVVSPRPENQAVRSVPGQSKRGSETKSMVLIIVVAVLILLVTLAGGFFLAMRAFTTTN